MEVPVYSLSVDLTLFVFSCCCCSLFRHFHTCLCKCKVCVRVFINVRCSAFLVSFRYLLGGLDAVSIHIWTCFHQLQIICLAAYQSYVCINSHIVLCKRFQSFLYTSIAFSTQKLITQVCWFSFCIKSATTLSVLWKINAFRYNTYFPGCLEYSFSRQCLGNMQCLWHMCG